MSLNPIEPNHQVKCVSPVTFSQKLHDYTAIAPANQEKVNKLLQEIAELVGQPTEVINNFFINSTSIDRLLTQQIKCITPMTYSQKLYQSEALAQTAQEIIEQYSNQGSTESLEKVRNLLEKIFQLAD